MFWHTGSQVVKKEMVIRGGYDKTLYQADQVLECLNSILLHTPASPIVDSAQPRHLSISNYCCGFLEDKGSLNMKN